MQGALFYSDTPTNEVRGVLSVHEKHLQGRIHVDITIGISTNCAKFQTEYAFAILFASARVKTGFIYFFIFPCSLGCVRFVLILQ